jgi:hypothetical protein
MADNLWSFPQLLGALWVVMLCFIIGGAGISYNARTRELMARQMENQYFFDRLTAPFTRSWPLFWNRMFGALFLLCGILYFVGVSFTSFIISSSSNTTKLYIFLNFIAQCLFIILGGLLIRSYRRGKLNLGRMGSGIIFLSGANNIFFIMATIAAVVGHIIVYIRCVIELQ